MKLNLVRTLLGDLASDDYVRFKYGKRIDAALKQLDQAATGPDAAELEARLLELVELVRGKPARGAKKGAGESAPAPKSGGRARPKKGTPDGPA